MNRTAAVGGRYAGDGRVEDGAESEDRESTALARVALKQEFLRRLELGESFDDALEATKLNIGKRALRRMRAAVKKGGVKALQDGRARNGRAPVFPPEVGTLLLNLYQEHPGAGPAALHAALVEALGTEQPTPSKSWVKLFLKQQDPALLLLLRKGRTAWEKNMAPRGTATGARRINERWQIDDCRTDLWVRVPQRDGTFDVAELWVTVIMDVHSRAIVSIVFSLTVPNAWTAMRALRKAILPKSDADYPMHGLPERLVMDRGKHFVSNNFLTAARELGIVVELCAPRAPNDKSELERWFGTLQRGRLATIHGYKRGGMKSVEAARKQIHKLQTIDWVKVAVEHWIVCDYHQREHSGLADTEFDWSPLNRWRAGGAIRHVDPTKLVALVPYLRREYVVGKKGIRLRVQGASYTYWAPELAHQIGRKARVRAMPGDRQSILVLFSDTPDDPLIEAWWMEAPEPRFATKDVVAARYRVRDGLLERMDEIARAAEQSSSRSPAAWVQVAEEADRLAVAEARVRARVDEPTAEEALLDDLEAMPVAGGATVPATVSEGDVEAPEDEDDVAACAAKTDAIDERAVGARADQLKPSRRRSETGTRKWPRTGESTASSAGPTTSDAGPANTGPGGRATLAEEQAAIERLAATLPAWRYEDSARAPATLVEMTEGVAMTIRPQSVSTSQSSDISSLVDLQARRTASTPVLASPQQDVSALNLLLAMESSPRTSRATLYNGATKRPVLPETTTVSTSTSNTDVGAHRPSTTSASPSDAKSASPTASSTAATADAAVLALLRAV